MASGTIQNYVEDITHYADASASITVNKSFGTDSVSVWKIGNIVTVSLRTYSTTATTSLTGTTTIFTLPTGYRPNRTTTLVGIGSKTTDLTTYDPVLFSVDTNGAVHTAFSGTFYQVWFVGSFAITNL